MEAIVLARKDFREYDQLISFYTKEYGKIELLARGVKKIVSKNSAHLEPFSNVLVETAKGKEIDHLTRVVPILFFANIRQNLSKSLSAGYLVYFLEKLLETGEADKRVYDITLDWLKFTDKTENFQPILLDGLIFVLLSMLGFKPILEHCVICEKQYKDLVKEYLSGKAQKQFGFYFSGGGLICADCRNKKEYIGESIWEFGLKQISGIELLLKGNWRLVNEFEFEPKEKKDLHKLVYEFVLFHSEKKMSDWGYGI